MTWPSEPGTNDAQSDAQTKDLWDFCELSFKPSVPATKPCVPSAYHCPPIPVLYPLLLSALSTKPRWLWTKCKVLSVKPSPLSTNPLFCPVTRDKEEESSLTIVSKLSLRSKALSPLWPINTLLSIEVIRFPPRRSFLSAGSPARVLLSMWVIRFS